LSRIVTSAANWRREAEDRRQERIRNDREWRGGSVVNGVIFALDQIGQLAQEQARIIAEKDALIQQLQQRLGELEK
jgi:hypothetical protein